MTIVTPTKHQAILNRLYHYEQNVFHRKAALKRMRDHAKGAMEWLDSEHWFQYVHGEHTIGKPQRMLGREAKRRNKNLEDKFFKDKSPDARMGHWFWMDQENLERTKKRHRKIFDSIQTRNDDE